MRAGRAARRAGMVSGGQARPRCGPPRPPPGELVQPADGDGGERLEGEVGQRRSPPEGQRLVEDGPGAVGVAGCQRRPALGGQTLEPVGVEPGRGRAAMRTPAAPSPGPGPGRGPAGRARGRGATSTRRPATRHWPQGAVRRPTSSSIRRSKETTWLSRTSSTASTARCRAAPRSTRRSPSVTSRGPSMANCTPTNLPRSGRRRRVR